MKLPKVIYTDVDGTLFGPRGGFFKAPAGGFTLKAAEALVSLLEKGVDLVPVSGRNREQLLENCRVLCLSNFISEMGSEIVYDLGKKIVSVSSRGGVNPPVHGGESCKGRVNLPAAIQHGTVDPSPTCTPLVPRPSPLTIFDLIASSGAPEMLLGLYSESLEYHDPWHLGRRYTHLFRGEVKTDEVDKVLAKSGYDWLKFVDNGRISRKSNSIRVKEMHAYHLCLSETSKSAAVKMDMNLRGIKESETIAIGDSAADFDLASEVGAFYLLGNAGKDQPAIKSFLDSSKNSFFVEEEMNLGWAKVASMLLTKPKEI